MTEIEILLALLFFAVAVLYSSVGHAGASGYIAAMALLGFAPEQMRPTALALNLLVGGIGLLRFWRGGHVRWRNVLPFAKEMFTIHLTISAFAPVQNLNPIEVAEACRTGESIDLADLIRSFGDRLEVNHLNWYEWATS